MPLAELFLGALISMLVERLASPELLNIARREGIDKLMKKWEERLRRIDHLLDDAEDKQLTGDTRVKSWLEGLRNLAYDIDDLLDEFATKYAQNKSRSEPGCSKARSILPSCCFRLSACVFMFDCKMRSKIEEMDQRLQEIITLKDGLSLRENNEQRLAYRRLDRRPPSTDGTEPCFISREDEKRQILEWLTRIEDDRTCVEVIAIVGMGGVGKTALAQQVYHDASLTYDEKAWACVSDNFDLRSITKSILEMTNRHLSCEGKTLNWLQDELKKSLSGKKFLVVLDDIWNENYDNWTTLLKPFQFREKGSKIIITTRHVNIALMARARQITLNLLSLEACMPLFAFHAFGVQNFDDRTDLEVLGRKIVEKCKGLPLAVKALAGLLGTTDDPLVWKAVLDSKIWDLPEDRINILPALKLSYFHLPPDLRRCFAYCAIFPQDYEIQRDELIRWWIAEGLVKGKEGKDRWNTGLNYFKELVCRSLFQKSSSSESTFLMHDLVNDLAKLVAGATHFSSGELEFKGNQDTASLARHASFISSRFNVPERFKIYHGMKGLRSFISLSKRFGPSSFLSQKVICDLLQKLKYLRVLSLSCYCIKEVPDCIGKLRHLRHLNLSYTNIKTLPKSIVALYNLEALMLRGCGKLIELPEDMEKLINLRFLDITDTKSLRGMPLNLGNLVGLVMLSKFVVGTENGSRLKELKNLENLGGEFCISNLHKVQEARDAADANLSTKEGICRLNMQWCNDFADNQKEKLEAKVLDFLCPHQNLANLEISDYGGLEFPSWLGSPLYVNIVHLRLHGCCRAKVLPSLGQLFSLKELYIEGLNAICKVGSEFYGARNPFMSLITLEFEDMTLWEDWSHCVGTEEVEILFPCLKHLVIRDCPMLIGRLPSQLSSLIELEINSCPRLDALPSITSLPSLEKLMFRGCNEGVLKSLVNLTSLTTLVMEDVANLTCLSHGFASSLIKLEKLEIRSCKKLMYLWEDSDVIGNLACLKRLLVLSCTEFISFTAGEGDMELPGNLETVELLNCVNLEKLPSQMHNLSSLIDLRVCNCPKLVSFPETGIPTSVISLDVSNCNMLQSLPRGLSIHPDEPSGGNSSSSSNNGIDMTSCLQKLTIRKCDSLPASLFSEDKFLPAALKTLWVASCNGVESFAEKNVDRLRSLQSIQIWGCHNLRSLPPCMHTLSHLTSFKLGDCPALELECFPPLPPSISSFALKSCPKIKSLPNELHRLTCLRELALERCESIVRFPHGGLPPQLYELTVWDCGNMKQPVREWLNPLTSLQSLNIDGSAGGVGEEEDLRLPLPSSLLKLHIYDMGNVERLSSSLPPSLRTLGIIRCPKLRELPLQDGLPPSLEQLWIYGCGILEERCKKGTGCYWPLIREIPQVKLGELFSESIT